MKSNLLIIGLGVLLVCIVAVLVAHPYDNSTDNSISSTQAFIFLGLVVLIFIGFIARKQIVALSSTIAARTKTVGSGRLWNWKNIQNILAAIILIFVVWMLVVWTLKAAKDIMRPPVAEQVSAPISSSTSTTPVVLRDGTIITNGDLDSGINHLDPSRVYTFSRDEYWDLWLEPTRTNTLVVVTIRNKNIPHPVGKLLIEKIGKKASEITVLETLPITPGTYQLTVDRPCAMNVYWTRK